MDDLIICRACGQEGAPAKKYHLRCRPCYQAVQRERMAQWRANPKPIVTCPKCGTVGPQYRFEIHTCRECYTANTRQRRAAGKARILAEGITIECRACGETKLQYHPGSHICGDCTRARIHQWERDNRDRINRSTRRHRAANPEPYRESGRRWRAANVEKKRAAARAYYLANTDAIQRRRLAARLADPERFREYQRRWAKKNPESLGLGQMRRRARMIKLARIPQGWKRNQAIRQGGKCAGCSGKFGRKFKPEIDHIVSLKKGGTNDLTNLQLLCRFCNCSKQDMDETDWRRRFRGQLL